MRIILFLNWETNLSLLKRYNWLFYKNGILLRSYFLFFFFLFCRWQIYLFRLCPPACNTARRRKILRGVRSKVSFSSETYSSARDLRYPKSAQRGMSCEAQGYRVTCRYKSRRVRRHSNFRFQAGARPQSNLERSTMHKWSNDPRAVHKLVTYSVTMLPGTLGVIPLRVPPAISLSYPSSFPSLLPRPPYGPVLFSSPLFRLAVREMYRAVTLPPLNPSEWAVPPWRTYRTNFTPVHDATARSLKGMKAVCVYLRSPANSPGAAFEIYLSRYIGGPLSSSTIPYGSPAPHPPKTLSTALIDRVEV